MNERQRTYLLKESNEIRQAAITKIRNHYANIPKVLKRVEEEKADLPEFAKQYNRFIRSWVKRFPDEVHVSRERPISVSIRNDVRSKHSLNYFGSTEEFHRIDVSYVSVLEEQFPEIRDERDRKLELIDKKTKDFNLEIVFGKDVNEVRQKLDKFSRDLSRI